MWSVVACSSCFKSCRNVVIVANKARLTRLYLKRFFAALITLYNIFIRPHIEYAIQASHPTSGLLGGHQNAFLRKIRKTVRQCFSLLKILYFQHSTKSHKECSRRIKKPLEPQTPAFFRRILFWLFMKPEV